MIRIHKEGRAILLSLLLVVSLVFVFLVLTTNNGAIIWSSGILLCGLFLFVCLFFRNPKRNFLNDPSIVVSPADGKIVVIEEVDEPEYFRDKRLQVSVFMSVTNVHVNRWPLNGTVSYFKHHSGRFYAAFLPKASTENERATVVLETVNGLQILIRQIAGALARRIVSYVEVGGKAIQNEDMGFIKFGSRVDLFLPLNAEIKVKVGDTVKGGITGIAKI